MNTKSEDLPIAVETARAMVKAYANEGAKNTISYTKAVWFPVDQILSIAEKLKENNSDGLRIYFAQYTPDALESLPKAYDGRNTVLMVPTNNVDGEHKDDTDNIENRGKLCPDVCDGTEL